MDFVKALAICIVLVTTAAACFSRTNTTRQHAPAAMRSRITATLVDEHRREEGEQGSYWRVALRGTHTDTIAGLWSVDQPTVVGDSVVVGTTADTSAARRAFFRYDLRSHVLDTIPMPREFQDVFSDLVVSPHGDRFAWARFAAGTARPQIRAFPSTMLLREGPATAIAPADGRLTIIRWVSPTEALIHVWANVAPGRPWVRFRYSDATPAWRIDSLANGHP